MSRFPPIPPEQQDDQQAYIAAGVKDIYKKYPDLHYQNSAGELYGPYGPLYYTPELVKPFFELAFTVTRQERLSPRQRELVIMAVLARHNTPYVAHAHEHIGVKSGLSPEQISAATAGDVPRDLTEEEAATYVLALKMASDRRRLDDSSWNEALRMLRKDQIAGIAHLVSGYMYVALLTNVADVGKPEGSGFPQGEGSSA